MAISEYHEKGTLIPTKLVTRKTSHLVIPRARYRTYIQGHELRKQGLTEIGVGLVPGGGALECLPRLVGRSRALEFMLSGDDFDADIAERYGWVNCGGMK